MTNSPTTEQDFECPGYVVADGTGRLTSVHCPAHDELDRLKNHITSVEGQQPTDMPRRHDALERENRDLRTRLASVERDVDYWKDKYAGLLGEYASAQDTRLASVERERDEANQARNLEMQLRDEATTRLTAAEEALRRIMPRLEACWDDEVPDDEARRNCAGVYLLARNYFETTTGDER